MDEALEQREKSWMNGNLAELSLATIDSMLAVACAATEVTVMLETQEASVGVMTEVDLIALVMAYRAEIT